MNGTVQIPNIPASSKLVLIVSNVTKPNLVLALIKANYKTIPSTSKRDDTHTGIGLCADGSVFYMIDPNSSHYDLFTTSKTLKYNQSAFFFMCEKDIDSCEKTCNKTEVPKEEEPIPAIPEEPKPPHVPFTTQEEVDLLKNPPKELPEMSYEDIAALNELCEEDDE